MTKMIFVNLPVIDLAKSKAFYEAMGATVNPMFSDENGNCMVFSDSIYVMLLNHKRWADFNSRPIPDGGAANTLMLALSFDSKDEIDSMADKAASLGGQSDPNPKQDHGFMYSRSVADPDGHIWEPYWMDMLAIPVTESQPQKA